MAKKKYEGPHTFKTQEEYQAWVVSCLKHLLTNLNMDSNMFPKYLLLPVVHVTTQVEYNMLVAFVDKPTEGEVERYIPIPLFVFIHDIDNWELPEVNIHEETMQGTIGDMEVSELVYLNELYHFNKPKKPPTGYYSLN